MFGLVLVYSMSKKIKFVRAILFMRPGLNFVISKCYQRNKQL